MGCFGDGGAMFTNDDDIAKKIRMMANHGQSKTYYHDEIGCNSRLDSIQAAILRIKLRHLDTYSAARNKAASRYDELLKDEPKISTPVRAKNSTHVFHQYVMKLDKSIDREGLRSYLKEKGVPSNIYYPVPLNKQKAYASEGYYPVTYDLCETVFSIPMHTEFEDRQQEYIISKVEEYVNK